MNVRKQQIQDDLLTKFMSKNGEPAQDPTAGGLSTALKSKAPLDDAEAMLAEADLSLEEHTQTEQGEEDTAHDSDACETPSVAVEEPAGNAASTYALPVGGAVLGLVGVVQGVCGAASSLGATLAMGVGMNPSSWLVLGAVATCTGLVRNQVARTLAIAKRQQASQQDLCAQVAQLADRHAHNDRPPAQGEELERVLMALERQDEKVNNLTKALKMYGKPLMEIANGSADVTSQVTGMRAQVQALEQGLQKVGTGTPSGELTEAIARKLEGMAEKFSPQGLQQQLVRLEASVQAISQRLDDSEVRKSLLRLEDAEKARSRKLEELARTDTVHQDVEKLENQIDRGLGKLGNVLEQVRNGNLGAIETSMRDMQRELAGLATAVAQIQQSVRTGGGRNTAAGSQSQSQSQSTQISPNTPQAPASQNAAPTAMNTAETSTTAAKPAAAPAVPTDTQSLSDAQAGAAQNQTGTRATSGKNVLGAIAKLKKLKN